MQTTRDTSYVPADVQASTVRKISGITRAEAPGRRPPSISACRTQVRSASGMDPELVSDPLGRPRTRRQIPARIRVARSLNSSLYFLGAATTLILPGMKASTRPDSGRG